MSRLTLALLVTLLLPRFSVGQPTFRADARTAERASALLDLRGLEAESSELARPLARAAAKAEIAAAAWPLDEAWAKGLLREAYELTLPDEAERERLRGVPIGAELEGPTGSDTARSGVRFRVLQIASRDKVFSDELLRQGAQQLGMAEQHYSYTSLAAEAIRDGDTAAAGNYALQAFAAEPTLISAGAIILDVAARDRQAADQLILRYIERLRGLKLSSRDHGALRIFFLLSDLIFNYNNSFNLAFNNRRDDPRYRRIAPPGPEVLRAYAAYVVESLTSLEQREPGSLRHERATLLAAWEPLRRHAPELTPAFMELERLSRTPGQDDSLEAAARRAEEAQRNYERRMKDASERGQPDLILIHSAIGRSDFAKARKLIDKLPDGAQKRQLGETADAREALSLAAEGDLAGAETLAARLRGADSILQVYPALVRKHLSAKESAAATRLALQAAALLKRAEAGSHAPPPGVPASAVAAGSAFDGALLGLGRLAALLAPADANIAFEILDEMVAAANRSEFDTGQGRTGFDAAAFKLLAADDEARARQAAEGFKDRLRRLVALANIHQAKAEARGSIPKPRAN
jgi:hypothetical protein